MPLALTYWTPGGIQFIDLWSVRRLLDPPFPDSQWPALLGGRRPAEALAMFLQFQEQVANLVSNLPQSTLSAAQAGNYFLYLPPAGMVPLSGFGPNGFNSSLFFSGRTTRGPFFIEGVRLQPLARESLFYTPVNLAGDQQMMWLYMVRENMQAVTANAPSPPAPGLIFTSGYMSYQAEPQFNLSHWNYGNFALVRGL